MFNQVRQRYKARQREKAALQVAKQGHGYAVWTWAIPTAANTLGLHDEIRTWLAQQLSQTSTPYGFSRYRIMLGLVATSGNERTALWKDVLDPFSRAETTQGLDAAVDRLATLPYAEHPTATHLEVYLLSMGDILKHAYRDMGLSD